MSTKFFPAPITFRIISKPRLPGNAPHTMSESSSSLVRDDPWKASVLTERIFPPSDRARFSRFASMTTISENLFDRARSRAISDPTIPDPMTRALSLFTHQIMGSGICSLHKHGCRLGEERANVVGCDPRDQAGKLSVRKKLRYHLALEIHVSDFRYLAKHGLKGGEELVQCRV